MNQRIKELALQADIHGDSYLLYQHRLEKFAELIVGECCLALWTEECHTSDLAFDEVKRNATRIKEHFGIDPKEITEDMLARSITWMEQQLADRAYYSGDRAWMIQVWIDAVHRQWVELEFGLGPLSKVQK